MRLKSGESILANGDKVGGRWGSHLVWGGEVGDVNMYDFSLMWFGGLGPAGDEVSLFFFRRSFLPAGADLVLILTRVNERDFLFPFLEIL